MVSLLQRQQFLVVGRLSTQRSFPRTKAWLTSVTMSDVSGEEKKLATNADGEADNKGNEEFLPDSNKRQNEGSDMNQKNNRSKKRKKKDRVSHTWRVENESGKSDDYVRNFGSSKTEAHAGSYANPAMREMFGITLPPHLLPPTSQERKEEASEENGPRNFAKRKVAFLLGYLGKGYAGFQTNEGQKTLQSDFELALLKAELLNPLNMGFFHKYGWSTSGRTDKGVSVAMS